MKHRFEDLELPEEKEIYRQDYEDEPHPLKDEEWMWEVGILADTIEWMSKDLRQQIQYLAEQTPVLSKFKYLKGLLEKYGNHTPDCKYMSVVAPRLGEEYSLCTCGWYELSSKLKRAKRRW